MISKHLVWQSRDHIVVELHAAAFWETIPGSNVPNADVQLVAYIVQVEKGDAFLPTQCHAGGHQLVD
jgi:hypothetical protein